MNTVRCTSCNNVIRESDRSCPECGSLQYDVVFKSKTVAIVLGLVLGCLGAHRFYLGNPLVGCAYLAATVVGTVAPVIWVAVTFVALVDVVVILFTSTKKFRCRVPV